jgi:hypothetical protein
MLAQAASVQPVLNDPEEFLTGFWTTGEAPRDGQCVRRPNAGSLVQFDFGEAEGRMVTYNSFDAFIFGPITVEKTGEATLLLAEVDPMGSAKAPSTLRVLSNDSFELAASEDVPEPITFNRCRFPEVAP